MTLDAALLDVIEDVYSAAEDPARWPVVVERIVNLLGCAAGALYVADLARGTASIGVPVNCDPAFMNSYQTYYAARDAWSIRAEQQKLLRPGVVLVSEMILDPADLRKTEYYTDWLMPQRFERSANVCISKKATLVANLNLMRARGSSEFDDAELRFLRLLTPHLRRATDLHRLVAETESAHRSLVEVLDRMPQGAILLSDDGTVCHMNRAASDIIAMNDGVSLTGTRLQVAGTRASAELRRLIKDAVASGIESMAGGGGSMRCERPSGKTAFQLLVTKIASQAGLFSHIAPAVAVFVSDPASATVDRIRVWRSLYGLTGMEAAVAERLTLGERLDDIAASLGITRNTVKTHLEHTFNKTATRRQSDLVRQLVTGVS